MGEWNYTREDSDPLVVNMSDGRTLTLNQGESFVTTSACEMLDFLENLPNDEGYSEERDGVVEDLTTEAQAEGCIGPDGNANANPDPGATGSGTATQPPVDDGDSGDLQGAPNVQPPSSLNGEPTTDGQDSGPVRPEDEPREPPQGQPESEHSGEEAREQTGGGDPVHLFRGAFFLEETDFDLHTSTLPLSFIRRYQSGFSYFGPFGWNWDHNHNVYLRELNTGAIARWNGRLHEDIFTPTGAGFEPPRGVFELLEQKPGIAQAYLITGTEGLEWHFERPAGWTAAEKIPLVLIRDRHNNTLQYSYNAENQLEEVRDDDNRFIRFEYGDCGLLEAVLDHSGRRIDYDHAPDVEHLVCVRLPATTDYPEGTQKTYHYDLPYLPPELRHNIVRVEDGEGLIYLENVYEQDPSSFHYTRVVEQLYGDYLYQFRYTPLQYVPPLAENVNIPALRVEVMDPECGVTTHTYNYRGDLIDFRYRLNKDRSFRVVAYVIAYDEQGNRSRIVLPDGAEEVLTHAFDDADPRMRGRLLRRELRARTGFPAPSRIIFQVQYEATFQLIKRIVDESLQQTEYFYDFDLAPDPSNTGTLQKIVLPDVTLPDGTLQSAEVKFEYDARGRIEAVVSPTGIRRENQFGTAGDDLGLITQITYDADALSIINELHYDSLGNLRETIDGEGHVSRFIFNRLNQLEAFTLPAVNGISVENRLHYSRDGYLIGLERPAGDYSDPMFADTHISDNFERNVLGHVEVLNYGANTNEPLVVNQCLDFTGRAVLATDSEGTETHQTFDERGYLINRTIEGSDGSEKSRKSVYDRAGRLSHSIRGQDNPHQTQFEYDAFGRLSKITSPNLSEQRHRYGRNDTLIETTIIGDPGDGSTRLLSQTSFDYDERQRMIRRKQLCFTGDPAFAVELATSYFYDGDDRLVATEDHRGAVTRFRYDGMNRLVEKSDPEGNVVRFQYDGEGRTVREERLEVETGATISRDWQWTYDARGRRTGRIHPDGAFTQFQYDDRDLLILQAEPLGVEKSYVYGQLGELLQTTLDPTGLNIVHRWHYNGKRQPVSYIDPEGEVTIYRYDGIGRPIGVQQSNGFASSRSFDQDGRLATETLASGVNLTFGYDFAGRLNRIFSNEIPGVAIGVDLRYAYDGRNQLISAQTGTVIIDRAFDSLGRLISESQNGTIQRVAYDDLNGTIDRFWPDGRQERIGTDLNGRAVELDRLAAGTVANDTPQLGRFQLTGPSIIESATLLDTVDMTYGYDIRKRPISLRCEENGTVLEQLSYRYDARNRTRYFSSTLAQVDRFQVFDSRDRLRQSREGFAPPALSNGFSQADQDADTADIGLAAAAAAELQGFTYNDADDRLTHQKTGTPDLPYTYIAGHRIAAAGAETFSYHPDGTRATDALHQYEVDTLGRVTTIRDGSTAAILYTFDYDALGRPVAVSEGGGPPVQRFYLGDHLVQEDQGGALLRQVTPHPLLSIPLAIHQGGQTLIPIYDMRYNRIGLLDTAGQIQESYQYEPFGQPRIFDSTGTPLAASAFDLEPTFGGMRYLVQANLYQAKRRLMDPRHGSFLSSDPLGYWDSPSTYVYVRQNPADYVDPDGDLAFLAGLAIAAVVGAVVSGGFNGARQGIAIAEGSQDGWEWGQFGTSIGIGAVAGPLLVVAPELVVPLATFGVANGVSEIANGNIYTGGFDILTSALPFGLKSVRGSVFGQGSLISRGPTASPSTRTARFTQLGESSQQAFSRIWNKRFYRGTTAYEAAEAETLGSLNIEQVFGRQHSAESPPRLGPGLYFGSELEPAAPGSAPYWADTHGGRGVGGGPGILEATISRIRWALFRRQPKVVDRVAQPDFETAPSNLETFIPEESGAAFNEAATWRHLPMDIVQTPLGPQWRVLPEPGPNFAPLLPELFTGLANNLWSSAFAQTPDAVPGAQDKK